MDEWAARIERFLQHWSKWAPIFILIGLALSIFVMVLRSPDMVSELKARAGAGEPSKDFAVEAVNYGNGRNKAFDADFYYPKAKPAAGVQLSPAVVIVHGGAWRSGDRFEMNDIARFFASNGYGVLNIETPLNGNGGGFPRDIVAAKDAVAYLYSKSDRFHIDRSRIFLLGLSSGAHVALMAAYTANQGRFAPSTMGSVDCKVRAVAAIAPPTELTGVRDNLTREYLEAGGYKDSPENLRLASPLSHVAGAVPTVLMHGDADGNVPYKQSQLLMAALSKQKVRSHLVTISGADHFIMGESKTSGLQQLLDFFNESMAP